MTTLVPMQSIPTIAMWTLWFAATGFVCGFLGPIVLNPEANQGPLLGIFITGPGGAIAGVVMGLIMRFMPLAADRQWRLLIVSCGLGAVTILFFCLPQPKLQGYVIEAELLGCDLPVALLPAALQEWQQRIDKVDWAEPRTAWREDMQQKAASASGVIVRMKVLRQLPVYEHRKPWNNGKITADSWQSVAEEKTYYSEMSGDNCDNYPIGKIEQYFPSSENSTAWPTDLLPNFLGVQSLSVVPVVYRQAIQ